MPLRGSADHSLRFVRARDAVVQNRYVEREESSVILRLRLKGDNVMTWIKTVPLSEVDEKLRSAMEGQRALYPVEYATPVHPDESGGSTIVGSHSLIPEALYHAFGTFGALMSPELPLSRRQHEMIATMVSVTNQCVY